MEDLLEVVGWAVNEEKVERGSLRS